MVREASYSAYLHCLISNLHSSVRLSHRDLWHA